MTIPLNNSKLRFTHMGRLLLSCQGILKDKGRVCVEGWEELKRKGERGQVHFLNPPNELSFLAAFSTDFSKTKMVFNIFGRHWVDQ